MEAFKKGGQLTQNIEQDICWMEHDETSIVHDGNNHGKPIKIGCATGGNRGKSVTMSCKS
jgi:hypothetical protein